MIPAAILWLCRLSSSSSSAVAEEEAAAAPGGGFRYAAQIDAGSSGSRVHLYKYRPRSSVVAPGPFVHDPSDPEEVGSSRVTPGLASYAEDPSAAGRSLAPLFDFVREKLTEVEAGSEGGAVVATDPSDVPVFLGATAGKRVLTADKTEAVMDEVRRYVASESGFRVDDPKSWIRVIAGNEEGAFAWLALNWISGAWNDDDNDHVVDDAEEQRAAGRDASSFGVIDMGGASTELAFRPEEDVLSSLFPLSVGREYVPNLYSHSFLYFGFDEALALYNEELVASGAESNPCLPVGVETYAKDVKSPVPGSANGTECARTVAEIFPTDVPCFHGDRTRCSMLGVYQPLLPAETTFYAVGYPVFLWKFMGLEPNASLADLEGRVAEVCAMNATELAEYSPSPFALNDFCFGPWFVINFFHGVFGLPMEDTPLVAADEVDGTGLGWALGSAVVNLNRLDWEIMPAAQSGASRAGSGFLISTVVLLACFGR